VTTIIVLFGLKAGVDRAVHERWARETDLPIVDAPLFIKTEAL